jgi:hypothetical protein
VRQGLESFLAGEIEPRSFGIEPRFQLAAVGNLDAVEQPSSIEVYRFLELTARESFFEFGNVGFDGCRIQPEVTAFGEERIDIDCTAGRVNELIESMAGSGRVGFGPDERLDSFPRQAALSGDGKNCEKPEAALLHADRRA